MKEKGVHALTLLNGMSVDVYDKLTNYLRKDLKLYGMYIFLQLLR